mgnify:CR=1 FL=1
MTTQERANVILKGYFKLKHDVDNFTIYNIDGDTVRLSFKFKNNLTFINDRMRVISVEFSEKKIFAAVDLVRAENYLQKRYNDVNKIEVHE